MSFTDTINVSDNADAHVDGKLIYSSSEITLEDSKIILNNVLSDDVKKELLILLSADINWVNAYKIYEILKGNYLKETQLKKIPELKYFAHSANSPDAIGVSEARHAVQKHDSPKVVANLNLAHKELKKLSLQFIKGT